MTKHIRDHRGKNWFWAENAIIDVYGPQLGSYAVAVYMVLCRMADDSTQTAYPSHNTIARRLNVSKPTVIKALKALEAAGLVDILERPKDNKENESNIYTLLPMPHTLPPGQQDLPGSQGDLPGGQSDVLEPGKGDLPKQDTVLNKTKEQGDSSQKLKPSLAKAARVAYANLDPGEQQYINRVAADDGTDIEAAMWRYRDSEVARALKSGK